MEKELNREQIINGLECLNGNRDRCPNCSILNIVRSSRSCKRLILDDAISLIKELTEDNEAQAETITSLLKTIEGVQGVKSEYETFIGGMKCQIDKIKAETKADTVRKMQERLKAEAYPFPCAIGVEYAVPYCKVDQIAKEMLEGNNGSIL